MNTWRFMNRNVDGNRSCGISTAVCRVIRRVATSVVNFTQSKRRGGGGGGGSEEAPRASQVAQRLAWSKKTALCNATFETQKHQITGFKSLHFLAFRHVTCMSGHLGCLPRFSHAWNVKEQPAREDVTCDSNHITFTERTRKKSF